MITLYGIKNCDTVRKALKWLDAHGVEHRFHDLRKDGMDTARLEAWCTELGIEHLINTRGTTWRKLPEERRAPLDTARAVALMLEFPAIIKRPILDIGNRRIVGFDEKLYNATLLHPL